MEKRINLENGDVIIFNINPLSTCDMITINKGYFKNGNLNKTIGFSMWDDFAFEAWCDNDEGLRQLDFYFEKTEPLYSHLERLLGQDDVLIIDDDDTYDDMKRIMKIYKTENNIIVSFENQLEELREVGKFHIFIKNVLTDYRSKIDRNEENTKIRLINFFRGIQNEFFDTNLEMLSEDKVKRKI